MHKPPATPSYCITGSSQATRARSHNQLPAKTDPRSARNTSHIALTDCASKTDSHNATYTYGLTATFYSIDPSEGR